MATVRSFLGLGLVAWGAACGPGQEPAAQGSEASPDATGVTPVQAPRLTYGERQGQRLFRHYCAICHGAGGAGDGFNAWNLDPRPRDLTDAAYQRAVSDAGLREVITQGGLAINKSSLMPGWGKTLSAAQIDAVTAYVRALGRREQGPRGPEAE